MTSSGASSGEADAVQVGAVIRSIAVITDVHANLSALDAALDAISDLDCEEIVHTGDAIGIGPYPAETLARLLSLPRIRFLIGNHDEWFAYGLPRPRAEWMSPGEEAHHHWVHAQLDRADPGFRAQVAAWPWILDDEIEGVRVRFQHYALQADGFGFGSIVAEPVEAPGSGNGAGNRDGYADSLDGAFTLYAPAGPTPDVVFYGHHHPQSDLVGPSSGIRYVNPGALGCSHEPLARFAVLRVDVDGAWDVTHHAVPYDVDALMHAYDELDVPERDLIRAAFFGR